MTEWKMKGNKYVHGHVKDVEESTVPTAMLRADHAQLYSLAFLITTYKFGMKHMKSDSKHWSVCHSHLNYSVHPLWLD